jgi:hypothetical protein
MQGCCMTILLLYPLGLCSFTASMLFKHAEVGFMLQAKVTEKTFLC